MRSAHRSGAGGWGQRVRSFVGVQCQTQPAPTPWLARPQFAVVAVRSRTAHRPCGRRSYPSVDHRLDFARRSGTSSASYRYEKTASTMGRSRCRRRQTGVEPNRRCSSIGVLTRSRVSAARSRPMLSSRRGHLVPLPLQMPICLSIGYRSPTATRLSPSNPQDMACQFLVSFSFHDKFRLNPIGHEHRRMSVRSAEAAIVSMKSTT